MSRNIQLVKLGQLLNITTGKLDVNASSENGIYPFFTCAKKIYKINTYAFDDEAVLVAGNGDLNVKYYNGKFNAYQRTYILTAKNNEIDIKYLYFFMQTYIQKLRDKSIGGVIKYIKLGNLTDAKIPLLPLQDQQKIAQQLSQIEELINKREESIKLLDELTKSTFLDMFISIKDKKLFPLGDYIDFMTSGSRGWAQYYSETGAIFLRIQNVNNGKLFLDDIIRVNLPNKTEGTRTRVQENDLLMSITADLGRTAVIPKFFEEAYINQHLALLRLKLDLINPIYLSHYFCTDFAKLQVQKYNKGGAKAGLNFTDIKKINVLIPSKPLQDKFAEIVTQIEQIKTIYEDSLNELNNLFGSIAQKAFKGELDVNKIELIQKEQEEITMVIKLDENRLLEEIKKGDFDTSKYVNEHQNYDAIKDMIFKLIEDKKISQKFDNNSKKIILEAN